MKGDNKLLNLLAIMFSYEYLWQFILLITTCLCVSTIVLQAAQTTVSKPVRADIPPSSDYLPRLGPPPMRFEKKSKDFDRKDLIPVLKNADESDAKIVRKNGKIVPEFLFDYAEPFLSPIPSSKKQPEIVNTTNIFPQNQSIAPITPANSPDITSIPDLPSIIEKTFQQGNGDKVKMLIPFNTPYAINPPVQESTQSNATYIKK